MIINVENDTMLGRNNDSIYATKFYVMQKQIDKLQQENKILKENAENNDKVVDKVNWENQLLKKENKQLKDNWNKLKEWVDKSYDYYSNNADYIGGRLCFADMKNNMRELEQGSDSNVKD